MRMESDTFDELDLRVLDALEVNGRASFSRIGAVLGVSDQTVARRYRRLCAEGGLRVVAVRDAERLGQDYWTLRLRCVPDSAPAIADALAKRPDTNWIGLAAGGTEIIFGTRPRSPGDRDDLLLGKLPRTPSVLEIHAHQILHRFYGGPSGWLRKFGVLSADQVAALRPETGPPPAGPARIDPEDEPLLDVL
ncbi:AsnC family transcriptional regulator, partial [Streptomyces sp. SID5926]|nr:AsnC family transcriptional regulator [Streptomyces sp. SID5926]